MSNDDHTTGRTDITGGSSVVRSEPPTWRQIGLRMASDAAGASSRARPLPFALGDTGGRSSGSVVPRTMVVLPTVASTVDVLRML